MALNKAVFQQRALTAIIFVLVMLVGLLVNGWTFLALFTLIHFGCWIEFQKLLSKIDTRYAVVNPYLQWSGSIIGFGFLLWNTSQLGVGEISLRQLGMWIMAFGILFWIICVFIEKNYRSGLIKYTLLSLLYISLSWGLIIDLSKWSIDGYPVIVLTLIASIWLNDTLAYIVGSLIGKTPFSKISPKKTWEGTAGGALLAVIIITIVGRYVVAPQLGMATEEVANWKVFFTKMCISISLVGAIIGTLGDLLESKIKRMADVKDSGNIMPGHGGFLDRFDSLILATPIAWLLVWVSIHL